MQVGLDEKSPVDDAGARAGGDEDLVARAREGDYAAFEALVRAHQARVYGVALGILKNVAEAEEVAQETFLSAFEHLADFRGEAQFSTWLFRVATNHALMKLRKKKPEPQGALYELEPRMRTEGTSPFSALAQWARRPDDAMQSKEVVEAIDAALDGLSDNDRVMLLLRAFDGLSHQEIATLTGTTVSAVKSRLHRVRLQLRSFLDERLRGVLPSP